MTSFFVTGNVWLVLTLLMVLGNHTVRTQPDMVAFFGLGAWLDPERYNLLIVLCMAAAVICFVLAWKTRPSAAQHAL